MFYFIPKLIDGSRKGLTESVADTGGRLALWYHAYAVPYQQQKLVNRQLVMMSMTYPKLINHQKYELMYLGSQACDYHYKWNSY